MQNNETLSFFKEILDYDPASGLLKIKPDYDNSRGRSVSITKKSKKKNYNTTYLKINYKGKQYLSHRVIWFIFYGRSPRGVIDHIDGNGLNNSICNLRDVSMQNNMQNKKLYKKNKSGISGVIWEAKRKKWRVQFKGHTVGRFDDKFEACCARLSIILRAGGYTERHGRIET